MSTTNAVMFLSGVGMAYLSILISLAIILAVDDKKETK